MTDLGFTIKFDPHDFRILQPPRKLRADEQIALRWFAEQPFSGHEEVLKQLETVLVIEQCSHCASVGLTCEKSASYKAVVKGRVPIVARSYDVNGMYTEMHMHIVDGFIDELELWRTDGLPALVFPAPRTYRTVRLDNEEIEPANFHQ